MTTGVSVKMKSAFKILCVIIAVSLCVLSATFYGCSAKAEYVDDSFIIKSMRDSEDNLKIEYEYQISTRESGYYYIKFRADYGDGLKHVFETGLSVKKDEEIKTGSSYVFLPNAIGLKASDIYITVLEIWQDGDYKDNTAYFAIALVFGVAALGALAAGITLFVLDNKKKHGRKCVCAEECGEVKQVESEKDGQEEDKDTDLN